MTFGMLMHGKTFADMPHLEPTAHKMLDELVWWAKALRTAREVTPARAA